MLLMPLDSRALARRLRQRQPRPPCLLPPQQLRQRPRPLHHARGRVATAPPAPKTPAIAVSSVAAVRIRLRVEREPARPRISAAARRRFRPATASDAPAQRASPIPALTGLPVARVRIRRQAATASALKPTIAAAAPAKGAIATAVSRTPATAG